MPSNTLDLHGKTWAEVNICYHKANPCGVEHP